MFLQCEICTQLYNISWVSRSLFFSFIWFGFGWQNPPLKKERRKKPSCMSFPPPKKLFIPVQLKKLTSVGLVVVVQVQQPCTTVAIQLQYIHSALTNWLDSASWYLFTLFGSYCSVGERTHQETPGWNTGSAHWDQKLFIRGMRWDHFFVYFWT